MEMSKLKWTRLQSEIFRILTINVGNPINKRTIAKFLGFSPTAVSKALVKLEKQGIVKIKKPGEMNLVFVELSRNKDILNLKRCENLRLIYECGLSDFLEEKFPGTTIILFGSYSRGEDTIDSDIDIAIIESKDKNINLDKFEKILKREIRINFYENWKEINKNLKNNILNGIVLVGGIEL